MGDSGGTVTLPGGGNYRASGPPDFGPNVLIFDSSMGDSTIQSKIDGIFSAQQTSQFGTNRYAYFFKPGKYNLDVQVGFYMEVLGLGATPDDVSITGAVRAMAKWNQGNATLNLLAPGVEPARSLRRRPSTRATCGRYRRRRRSGAST